MSRRRFTGIMAPSLQRSGCFANIFSRLVTRIMILRVPGTFSVSSNGGLCSVSSLHRLSGGIGAVGILFTELVGASTTAGNACGIPFGPRGEILSACYGSSLVGLFHAIRFWGVLRRRCWIRGSTFLRFAGLAHLPVAGAAHEISCPLLCSLLWLRWIRGSLRTTMTYRILDIESPQMRTTHAQIARR